MISAPNSRHITAFSLASLYSTATTLTLTLTFWTVGDRFAAGALSQTLPPPANDISETKRPTAQQLVEQARQRLRDRGELPATRPSSTVTPPLEVTPPPSSLPLEAQPFNLYRLGAGDAIAVVVQRFPDLSFQAAIDQQGYITHPLLRKVYVQGLTIDEAQVAIEREVNKLIINPVVLVSLVVQRPILITMTGEIGRPGLYNLSQNGVPSPRVAAALLLAGGTTPKADLRAVKIQRPLLNGTTTEQTLDLITPLKEGTPLPDLRLQDGDVVVVPRLEPGTEKDYDRSLVARSFGKGKVTVRFLSYVTGRLAQLDLPIDSTFVDALTAIGPNPDNTNMRKIALVRFDPQQGKAITRELDGKKALLGDSSQNLALEENDVIVIGRNLVGRLTYALNTFTQPFRDVLGFLLFFRELQNSASNLFSPNNRNGN